MNKILLSPPRNKTECTCILPKVMNLANKKQRWSSEIIWYKILPNKIIANETTDKGLISKICKQLMKLNTRKQTTQSKSGQNAWTDISPKKTHKWIINAWKDAQHHSLLETCKSKLQWGITSQGDNRHHQKIYKQEKLERVWQKGNTLALSVGM